MCGLKNHAFSPSCMLIPTKQEREHKVRRTACCLPVAYHLPQDKRENVQLSSLPVAYRFIWDSAENVRFFEPYIPCLLCTIPHKTGESVRFFKPHILSLCLVPSLITQERELSNIQIIDIKYNFCVIFYRIQLNVPNKSTKPKGRSAVESR